jgi:hypothetical protein
MEKTKRLALLCLLLVVSASSAVVVQAAGLMQGFRSAEMTEITVNSASVSLILTAEDRQRVMDIVLMDSQVQQLLANADNYTIEVSEVFDIHDVSFELDEAGNGVALVPREGVAQATITINNDYGEEFGVQEIKVTVNLETEEITETDVQPEIVRPKIADGIVSIADLVENASKYDGAVVTVSGEVSLLREVFGSLFELDGTVTVTGRFVAPDTIYAETIEKN